MINRIVAKGPLTPCERKSVEDWLQMADHDRRLVMVDTHRKAGSVLRENESDPPDQVTNWKRTFSVRYHRPAEKASEGICIAVERGRPPYVRLEGGLWLSLISKRVFTDEGFDIGEMWSGSDPSTGACIVRLRGQYLANVTLPEDEDDD